MTLDSPLVLTTKTQRLCHERWLQFKKDFPDRVTLAKKMFDLAEASFRFYGPHLTDINWIRPEMLYEMCYGTFEPADMLLDVMHFPAHSDAVDRTRIIDSIRLLVREHEDYGSDGNYMPRSVILGWIARQHDLILRDLAEAA